MLDGGLNFETSYELSKVLAHASRDSDCLVLAYRCKTIPVSYNERDVVQIDRVTPLTLLSAGILAAPPNLSSAQARRMHEFAGRDVVLQQLFAFANAQPAGAGADPAADFGQDGSWVAKSIFGNPIEKHKSGWGSGKWHEPSPHPPSLQRTPLPRPPQWLGKAGG